MVDREIREATAHIFKVLCWYKVMEPVTLRNRESSLCIHETWRRVKDWQCGVLTILYNCTGE